MGKADIQRWSERRLRRAGERPTQTGDLLAVPARHVLVVSASVRAMLDSDRANFEGIQPGDYVEVLVCLGDPGPEPCIAIPEDWVEWTDLWAIRSPAMVEQLLVTRRRMLEMAGVEAALCDVCGWALDRRLTREKCEVLQIDGTACGGAYR